MRRSSITPAALLAALLLVGCYCGKDPEAVLDNIQLHELPLIQAAAAPLVAAIESYRQREGHDPPGDPPFHRIEGVIPRLPAPDVPGYDEFRYSGPMPGTTQRYMLDTCSVRDVDGYFSWSGSKMRCVAYYGEGGNRDPANCAPLQWLEGVARPVGDWCLRYHDTPPD